MQKNLAQRIKGSRKRPSHRGRIPSTAVFVYKKPIEGLPPRAQAIMNALEKLRMGTAEEVAKRVTKSDYSGEQDLVYLAGFFLRKFVKQGAVDVQVAEAVEA